MDNQRVFVWAALALVLWLNYVAWQRDYAPPPTAPAATAEVPQREDSTLPELPSSPGEATPTPEQPVDPSTDTTTRSEEHTSELQSRENLVCRLLLEKKKGKNTKTKYKAET